MNIAHPYEGEEVRNDILMMLMMIMMVMMMKMKMMMSMVEGEEVRNYIVMMRINRQMQMIMRVIFQEGLVSNGTVRGEGEEEESDVILCHKHEGEQFIVFRNSTFSQPKLTEH